MWRRSESEDVHSQRRSHASWRELCTCMDGSLAAEQIGSPAGAEIVVRRGTKARQAPRNPRKRTTYARTTTPPTRQGTLRPPMEKFVIEGGVPLEGTITPAGNKNGALPILAACLLTDDEVILRN